MTTYGYFMRLPLKLGETVDVLIDSDNPGRYAVTSVASISMKMR
jgi:hypothetical protein